MRSLLTESNTKTMKGEEYGYLTMILHLAPASISGTNVCPFSSQGCRDACLNTAGRGKFDKVQEARIRKTNLFFDDRPAFIARLKVDIDRAARQANKRGLKLAVRLNGTSDLNWPRIAPEIFNDNPLVTFYDYTKAAGRLHRDRNPFNYHLTFSLSEDNEMVARLALQRGFNVAVVFKGPLPVQHFGRRVVNGDTSDLRFLEGYQGVIVGLKAKGRAKRDTSGFVVPS